MLFNIKILPSSVLIHVVRCFEIDVSGLRVGPIFKVQGFFLYSLTLDMGQIGSPESSVSKCFTPRRNPEGPRQKRKITHLPLTIIFSK
jgi:hypothetical protein